MLGYVPGPQLDHVAIRVGHVGGSPRAVEGDLLDVLAALAEHCDGAGRAAYVTDPDGNVVELWTWDVSEHLR